MGSSSDFNTKNDAQDATIAKNDAAINSKVDGAVTDLTAKNDAQDTNINANTQGVIDANAKTDSVISRVDEQDTVIAKNTNDITTVGDKLDGEIERSDAINAKQDAALEKETADRTTAVDGLQTQVTENKDSITSIDKQAEELSTKLKEQDNTFTKFSEDQVKMDERQNQMMAQQSYRIDGLEEKVNGLDDTLSSGVASAMAIGSMPTMPFAGAQMITGGSAYFNGQGALAVGISGTTESGKVSYKIGGSYTKDGSSAFSMGGGYRWK